MKPTVQIKRVYDEATADDGLRVLVDRLWPRGMAKSRLQHDLWLKELAPSAGLRSWFGHRVERWDEFRKKYMAELDSAQARDCIDKIFATANGKGITLLYGARDTEHNQAVVLADVMRRVAPHDDTA